jgi:hypothetical protein
LHPFWCIPRSGIAGSYGRSMFSFLRSLQIFFQSGCTSLHSHQHCVKVPLSPHRCQHLLLVVYSIFDHSYSNRSEVESVWCWFAFKIGLFKWRVILTSLSTHGFHGCENSWTMFVAMEWKQSPSSPGLCDSAAQWTPLLRTFPWPQGEGVHLVEGILLSS